MKLERCLKIGPELPPASLARSSFSRLAGKFDWFYIGEEFCENLLPQPERLAASAAAVLAEGKKVCVLTPPVSEKGLAVLTAIFAGLKKIKGRFGNLELTVNDFGALELAGKSGLGVKLNAGRMLRHNAFNIDKNSMRVTDPRCLDGFAELGIRRFEVAAAGRGFSTNFRQAAATEGPRDFRLTMFYPYCDITSTRACLLGMQDRARSGAAGAAGCRRECKLASFEITHPFIKEKFIMRGNTLFLKLAGKLASERSLLASRIDRLVYDPF